MLFVMDVGNSNAVLGLYEGDELRAHWRVCTNNKHHGISRRIHRMHWLRTIQIPRRRRLNLRKNNLRATLGKKTVHRTQTDVVHLANKHTCRPIKSTQ